MATSQAAYLGEPYPGFWRKPGETDYDYRLRQASIRRDQAMQQSDSQQMLRTFAPNIELEELRNSYEEYRGEVAAAMSLTPSIGDLRVEGNEALIFTDAGWNFVPISDLDKNEGDADGVTSHAIADSEYTSNVTFATSWKPGDDMVYIDASKWGTDKDLGAVTIKNSECPDMILATDLATIAPKHVSYEEILEVKEKYDDVLKQLAEVKAELALLKGSSESAPKELKLDPKTAYDQAMKGLENL